MMPSRFPNYYELLHIPPGASQDEIRQAYKRESLKTHPDRFSNATPGERTRATEKFQAVADAYYVLSNPTRRREYDTLYASHSASDRTAEPDASSNFFANLVNMFASTTGTAPRPEGFAGSRRPDAEDIFGNVFEEMLRPEIDKAFPWWTYLGAVAGAILGFIVANLPGMLFGGYAGNRLGAIRDAKGKSVAAVFSQLSGTQKAEILRALAMKVLGSSF